MVLAGWDSISSRSLKYSWWLGITIITVEEVNCITSRIVVVACEVRNEWEAQWSSEKSNHGYNWKKLIDSSLLLGLLVTKLFEIKISYSWAKPVAPAKLIKVNEGMINRSSLWGKTLNIPTKIMTGPIIVKFFRRLKSAKTTAHVTPLGMATRKYQCQGETPHSLDLFSTPLK